MKGMKNMKKLNRTKKNTWTKPKYELIKGIELAKLIKLAARSGECSGRAR